MSSNFKKVILSQLHTLKTFTYSGDYTILFGISASTTVKDVFLPPPPPLEHSMFFTHLACRWQSVLCNFWHSRYLIREKKKLLPESKWKRKGNVKLVNFCSWHTLDVKSMYLCDYQCVYIFDHYKSNVIILRKTHVSYSWFKPSTFKVIS